MGDKKTKKMKLEDFVKIGFFGECWLLQSKKKPDVRVLYNPKTKEYAFGTEFERKYKIIKC